MERTAHQLIHGPVLLRFFLGFEEFREKARERVVRQRGEAFLRDGAAQLVFLRGFLREIGEERGGEAVGADTEVAEKLIVGGGGVDDEDAACEGLCDLLEHRLHALKLLVGGENDELVLNAVIGREKKAHVGLRKRNHQRKLVEQNPFLEIFGLAGEGDGVVERLVQHDRGDGNFHFIAYLAVCDVNRSDLLN